MKTLSDIKIDSSYVGYIWPSNSNKPELKDFDLSKYSDENNPFIVEGQLYSKTAEKSYSIKYVDGKHIVTEYDLKLLPEEYDLKEFIPNRIIYGVSKILFRQYWMPRKDELCEGMEVLVPAAYVFIGFEYNKEKEDK
jgi:CRISPR type III-associated protein (TIGR04423 family)